MQRRWPGPRMVVGSGIGRAELAGSAGPMRLTSRLGLVFTDSVAASPATASPAPATSAPPHPWSPRHSALTSHPLRSLHPPCRRACSTALHNARPCRAAIAKHSTRCPLQPRFLLLHAHCPPCRKSTKGSCDGRGRFSMRLSVDTLGKPARHKSSTLSPECRRLAVMRSFYRYHRCPGRHAVEKKPGSAPEPSLSATKNKFLVATDRGRV